MKVEELLQQYNDKVAREAAAAKRAEKALARRRDRMVRESFRPLVKQCLVDVFQLDPDELDQIMSVVVFWMDNWSLVCSPYVEAVLTIPSAAPVSIFVVPDVENGTAALRKYDFSPIFVARYRDRRHFDDLGAAFAFAREIVMQEREGS